MNNTLAARTFEGPTAFSRVGERDYVQGVVILNDILTRVVEATGAEDICVDRIKFTKRVLLNGLTRVSIGEPEQSDAGAAAANLRGSVDGSPLLGVFIPDPDRAVITQVNSLQPSIEDFHSDGNYGASFTVDASEGEAFLLSAVEANKRAVSLSSPMFGEGAQIEFVDGSGIVYSHRQMVRPGPVAIVNTGLRIFAGREYVLNEVRYQSVSGDDASFLLNYSIHRN